MLEAYVVVGAVIWLGYLTKTAHEIYIEHLLMCPVLMIAWPIFLLAWGADWVARWLKKGITS